MSIVRALDANGDWTFGSGRNNYKSNRDAVAQNIQTRLNSFLGDCFFDTGAGIDWFNFCGGSKVIQTLSLAISAVILNTGDVTGLVQLFLNLTDVNREFTVSYQVTTSFGPVSATVALNPNFLLTEDGDVITTEDGESIIV